LETTIKNKKELFYYKEKCNKTQIILCHTSRPLTYFSNSLKYRLDGEYTRIPTYNISKNGNVIQNFNPENYSDFFGIEEVDKSSIIVCLENLGWLKYNTLNDKYINWIGDTYKGKVYQKRWRDRTFWSNYPDKQLWACAKLIVKICSDYDIPLELIGHNVKIDGVRSFSGVTTRSNYGECWTDLSPSFDFEKLKTYIDEENEIQ
jgi:hypothetical protein